MSQQLANGKQQFIDGNGNPLAGGSVAFYAPGTPNPVNTWGDSGLTVLNANPVTLDANGMASIWGADGTLYRQVVTDANGNQVWDQVVGLIVGAAAVTAPDGEALSALLETYLARVVTSISALRNVSKAYYAQCFVTGYYASGDGGGGAYYYDASDTSSADNGGTVIVASDGGRWKLTHTGIVSVKQFGAKGDGTTDDTAALQAAINAAAGRSLYIPAGTYKISSSLSLANANGGYRIFGDAPQWSSASGLVGGTIIENANTAGAAAVSISAGGNGTIRLTDFAIKGNGSDGNGITISGAYTTVLEGLFIASVGSHGVELDSAYEAHLIRCSIGNIYKNGVYAHGADNAITLRDNLFFSCDGQAAGNACVWIDGVGGNSLAPVIEGNTFEGTSASTTAFGLVAKNTNALAVRSNYFEVFGGTGGLLYFDSTVVGFAVEDNYFQDGTVTFAGSTNGAVNRNYFSKQTITTSLNMAPPAAGATAVQVRANSFVGGATNNAPASFGYVSLASGSATVNNTNTNTGTLIAVTRITEGSAPGFLSTPTIVNGSHFVIQSSSATDDGAVMWSFVGDNGP